MVIVAYIRDQQIRANVANIFILNLAITDFIVGALVTTVNLSWLIKDTWVLGEMFCKLWLVLDYTVVLVSVWTMVMISWDRYCLLTMGLKYQNFQTKKRIGLILICTWVSTFIWYSTLAFAWAPITGQSKIDYIDDCEMELSASFTGATLHNVTVFFIPFSVLLILNLAVYANIKRRSRGVVGQSPPTNNSNQPTQSTGISQGLTDASGSPGNLPLADMPAAFQGHPTAAGPSTASSSAAAQHLQSHVPGEGHPTAAGPSTASSRTAAPHLQSQKPGNVPVSGTLVVELKTEERTFAKHRKAAIVLSILVGCFLLCGLPYQVSTVMYAVCGTNCVSDLTWEITNSLLWSNSTINPFIYAATNKHFRRNFRHYLLLDRWVCDIKSCKVKCNR
eukprot:XP_794595.1 PREDICTED: muscarinic acetylcholine receptor M5-like [Strongylocentrotus purpuratus]